MYNAPDEVIYFLVESYKSYHPEYEMDWRGMLLTLAHARVPLANIKKLLNAQQYGFPNHQQLVTEKFVADVVESDTNNANANTYRRISTLDTFEHLLRISMTERLDSLNVERWCVELKNAMSTFLEESRQREKYKRGLDKSLVAARKQNTTELYGRLALYELVKETMSILELALWRLKVKEINASNSSGYEYSKEVARVEMTQRELCRVNSGAGVIIPGVLCYLLPPTD